MDVRERAIRVMVFTKCKIVDMQPMVPWTPRLSLRSLGFRPRAYERPDRKKHEALTLVDQSSPAWMYCQMSDSDS